MITVVGSLNIDLSVELNRLPKKGETIFGNQLAYYFGGKGGNQAVALARLGESVAFIGAVGNDANGKDYIDYLAKEYIDVSHIVKIDDVATGMAVITLAEQDNSIIVIPGANLKLTKEHIREKSELIKNSDMVVLQFEVSDEVISEVIDIAYQNHVPILLNPAPYRTIKQEWLEKITYLTPNETEYEALMQDNDDMEQYHDKMIVTLGSRGVSFVQDNKRCVVGAPKVDVLDTTGAGDTFNGALVHFLQKEKLADACRLAVYTASLSTTKFGAQSGMPTIEQLEKFVEEIGE